MITLSYGKNVKDNFPRQKTFSSFREVVDYLKEQCIVVNDNAKELNLLPYICAPLLLTINSARGRRINDNVAPFSIAMIDVDQASVGVLEDLLKPCPIEYALYTTWSHSKEQPRFRLLISLDKEVLVTQSVKLQAVAALAAAQGYEPDNRNLLTYFKSGLSESSFTVDNCLDLARIMFTPVNTSSKQALIHYNPGTPASVLEEGKLVAVEDEDEAELVPESKYSESSLEEFNKSVPSLRRALIALSEEGIGSAESDWTKIAMALSTSPDKELAYQLLSEFSATVGGDTSENRERFDRFCNTKLGTHYNAVIGYATDNCTKHWEFLFKQLNKLCYETKLFIDIAKAEESKDKNKNKDKNYILEQYKNCSLIRDMFKLINSIPVNDFGKPANINEFIGIWDKALSKINSVLVDLEEDKDKKAFILSEFVQSGYLDFSKFVMVAGKNPYHLLNASRAPSLSTTSVLDKDETGVNATLKQFKIHNWMLRRRSNMPVVSNTAMIPTELYPTGSPVYTYDTGVKVFNTWTGLTVKPELSTDPTIAHAVDDLFLKTVVKEGLCANNLEAYNKFIEYFARKILRPNEKVKICLVVYGEQQVGKDITVENFGALIKQHYTTIRSIDRLLGKHSTIAANNILINASEIAFAKDKSISSALKDFITNDNLVVEEKYQREVTATNYADLYMSTNDVHAINMIEGIERRVLLLKVDAEPTRSYTKSKQWSLVGGIKDSPEALAHLLYRLTEVEIPSGPMDVTGINMHFKAEQAEISMCIPEKFVLDMVRGDLTLSTPASKSALYDGGFDIAKFNNLEIEDTDFSDMPSIFSKIVPIGVVKSTYRNAGRHLGHHYTSEETEAIKLFKELLVLENVKHKQVRSYNIVSEEEFKTRYKKYFKRDFKE